MREICKKIQNFPTPVIYKPEFRNSAPEKSYFTASGVSKKCFKKLPPTTCSFSNSSFKIKRHVYFYPLSVFNRLRKLAAWLQVAHYLNVQLLCQKAKQKCVNEACVFSSYIPTETF